MTCRRIPRLLIATLCVCGGALSESAVGQTTQPAIPATTAAATPSAQNTSTWTGVAKRFVSNVCGGEVEPAWTLMGPRARIDEFDPDAPATFARLVDLAKRATLLGVHPYETSPTTLAEDIAGDVRDATDVPEDLRRRMTPHDEDEAARANATAAQWLAQNLAAEKGQPLAAVVLWDATQSQLVFILLKGHKVSGMNPAFHITHVVFGNPLVVPR
jgi:hypothetical protein